MYDVYLNYNVDIVFCIDCTESMDNVLNIIKSKALSFYDDLLQRMQMKQKTVDQLRVRVVAFRDYLAYDQERRKGAKGNEPMMVTDFFRLPQEAEKLRIAVRSLYPIGGGDAPEDGLEALAYAIRSDWDMSQSAKHRHVVVLWTDAEPHPLGYGAGSQRYPRGMAQDMGQLTSWWGSYYNPGYMNELAKRLILFAPGQGDWGFISEQWEQVIHYPSNAGDGLSALDYDTILGCISESI